ncbi:MAG: hypothetical protein E7306_11430 [Butyrivibrio sp.]|nr:hypothetical protein [Butyrivibrio sp.]
MNAAMLDGRMINRADYFSMSEVRIRQNKKRRMEIVRRQRIVLGVLITVILSSLIFIGGTLMIKAQNSDTAPIVKYYTVVNVHGGDTLESLSKVRFSEEHYDSFDAYINEILRINHLEKPEDLKAGENVIIPYYDVFDTPTS